MNQKSIALLDDIARPQSVHGSSIISAQIGMLLGAKADQFPLAVFF